MNNDLISREALKKAICEKGIKGYEEYNQGLATALDLIDLAPTVEVNSIIDGLNNEIDDLSENLAWYVNERNRLLKERRPQGELKEYKPLEPDYNVQCAVENLRSAYWSNEPEKVAKNFTEAEDIIISAICHHGYAVCKQPQGELANEVWKLYEKHHSHLATHVIEFGDELKELLGKYQKGGAV